MKRLFVTALLTALSVLSINAAAREGTANSGRSLTGLWEKYQEAYKADKPQKEAEILQQIKQH